MNQRTRISKLEEITIPRKRISTFSNMERAVRLVYLLEQVQRGKTILISIEQATRLVDLVKCAAERRKKMKGL